MARNLGNLPDETLSLILGQFCLHCTKAHDYDSPDGYFRHPGPQHGQPDQNQDPNELAWYSSNHRKTLHSMCLVSKRFLPLAQSILYQEFILGYGDSWRSTKFSWDGRLASFVRTLAARPNLAALVKRVFVHCYLLRLVTEKEAQTTLDEVLGPAAHDYLADFEGVRSPFNKHMTVRFPAVEMFGLLLALVPNLERLGIQTEGRYGRMPAGALSTLARLLKTRPLAKLRTLDICGRSHHFSLAYQADEILETVASTGILETLNLHMCSSTALRLQRGSLRNLRAMRITHSRLGSGDLASLLDSCAPSTLESFVYEASYRRVDIDPCCCWVSKVDGGDHFQPSEAIQQLRRHKETLQSLHLDLRAFGFLHSLDFKNAEQPLSETLKDFTALQHVFISTEMLYNHHGRASYTTHDSPLLTSLLPPTIISLHLAGSLGRNTPRLANALLYLAKATGPRKQFRALRRVRCATDLARGGLDDYALRDVFAVCGVDFGYESFPLNDPTLREGEKTPREALSPVDKDIPYWSPSDLEDDL